MTPVMTDCAGNKTRPSRRESRGSPAPSRSHLFVVIALVLLTSPASNAYFMNCKQFCSVLTQEEIKQLWCIYNMCRDEKLGRHILRYAKRAPVGETADVSSPDDDALLAGDYYSGTVALSHGRKERFSGAQNNGIFQSVAKARRAIDAKRKRSHTDDKRDLEYWDGPAPADINA